MGIRVQTFKGHRNSKYFVGLTVNPNYIACADLYIRVHFCVVTLGTHIQSTIEHVEALSLLEGLLKFEC